jgi:hypothetical protein
LEPRIAGIADSNASLSKASGESFPFHMIYAGEMLVDVGLDNWARQQLRKPGGFGNAEV